MITIEKSKTADTRTCDYSKVTKEQLYKSSQQHKSDIVAGMEFFIEKMKDSMVLHDDDKLKNIDGFHADFLTGFKQTGWWDEHRKIARHHLMSEDGVPIDVNLIDVMDMIVDCVMAGMGRSGSVYPLEISGGLLLRAFNNTVELLKAEIVVKEEFSQGI